VLPAALPRQHAPEPDSGLDPQKCAGLSPSAANHKTMIYPPLRGGSRIRFSPKSRIAQGDADKRARAGEENWRSFYKCRYLYLFCTRAEKLGPVFTIQRQSTGCRQGCYKSTCWQVCLTWMSTHPFRKCTQFSPSEVTPHGPHLLIGPRAKSPLRSSLLECFVKQTAA